MNQFDPTELPKQGREQLKTAGTNLAARISGVDASAVFASYALSSFLNAHSECSNRFARPAPAAVELAAWLLLPHFGKPGTADPDSIQNVITAIEHYQKAFVFAEMFTADDDDYDELRAHLRLHTGNVRGSAYPVQVNRRIEGALGSLEEDFRAKYGVGPLRAKNIALAILEQTEENINTMRAQTHAIFERLKAASQTGDTSQAESLTSELEASMACMGGDWIPTRRQIEAHLPDLTTREWEALIKLIGLTPDTLKEVAKIVDLQDRPLYFTTPDKAFSFHGTSVLDAIFSFFDNAARDDPKLVNRYVDAASQWMEETIAEFARRVFPKSSVIQSACFPDPDHPGGETEADVVIYWGPFLVVFEAKNNRISNEAVRDGSKRLKNVLSKNVQDAFIQARRIVRVLETNGKVTFTEKSTGRRITATNDGLRRVFPISVTMQHLFGITTQLAVTQRLGLFKGNAFPWSVSLDDLDVVTRFSATPDIFLFYIERRTAHQSLDIHLRGDELDIFGQFLDNRLHPSIYEARTEIAEHQDSRAISFHGGEERFAPFYDAEWYKEEPPQGVPTLDVPPGILTILKELRRRQDDDARFIAFALLRLNHAALVRIARAAETFRNTAPPTRQIHRTTFTEDGIVINVMAHASLSDRDFFGNVTLRTRMEHYRAKARATISLGIDLRKAKAFEIAQWLEGEWRYEPAIEKLLQEESSQNRTVTLPTGIPKPGRNSPCPCGSGRKSKKCCLEKVEIRRADR